MHRMHFRRAKYAAACLLLIFLAACVIGTQPPFAQETSSTAREVSTLEPGETHKVTPTTLVWITREDQFGDGFIALIPIKEVESQPPIEVLRVLVQKWLDHYTYDSQDIAFKLEDFSIGDAYVTEFDDVPYILVAKIEYRIKEAKPGLGNGWNAGGAYEENGWTVRHDAFGFFKDGEYYRLRFLPGWGT